MKCVCVCGDLWDGGVEGWDVIVREDAFGGVERVGVRRGGG